MASDPTVHGSRACFERISSARPYTSSPDAPERKAMQKVMAIISKGGIRLATTVITGSVAHSVRARMRLAVARRESCQCVSLTLVRSDERVVGKEWDRTYKPGW